jgi:hypothetical protein
VLLDDVDGIETEDELIVRATGILTTNTPLSATTVTVDGTLTHAAANADGVTVTATDMSIGPSGSVIATGRGFGQVTGPGRGTNGTACTCGNGVAGSGAGHGGLGGAGHGGTPAGGLLYGSRQGAPVDLGSGGGVRACSASGTAGLGGGLIHLFIDGTLAIDGGVRADGTTSATNHSNGGGSGGSIWLTATNLTTLGTPMISANGGNGTQDGSCGGIGAGGGGGGRIAIFADVNDLGGAIATAFAGTGAGSSTSGNPGIVYQFPGNDSLIALDAPLNGGSGIPSGTTLSWSGFALTGTQHFHVELDDDPHFDASANHPEVGDAPVAIVNEIGGTPGGRQTTSSWTTPALTSGKTYYWHVVAHNSGNGFIGGSRTSEFTVP